MRERQREPRHAKLIRVAIKRGLSTNAETNTAVYYTKPSVVLLGLNGTEEFETPGGFRELLTLNGPMRFMTGQLQFFHHDTRVLVVNFDQGWISDHGYHDYSMTTQRNIDGWMDALKPYLPNLPWEWHRWTTNWRRKHEMIRQGRKLNTLPEMDEDLMLFRNRVPWTECDNHYITPREQLWKFYWKKFDQKLADAYWDSRRFLREDLNRRYFRYDWSIDTPGRPLPHHWIRHFIDRDAERRWRNRERRNGRPCPRI